MDVAACLGAGAGSDGGFLRFSAVTFESKTLTGEVPTLHDKRLVIIPGDVIADQTYDQNVAASQVLAVTLQIDQDFHVLFLNSLLEP